MVDWAANKHSREQTQMQNDLMAEANRCVVKINFAIRNAREYRLDTKLLYEIQAELHKIQNLVTRQPFNAQTNNVSRGIALTMMQKQVAKAVDYAKLGDDILLDSYQKQLNANRALPPIVGGRKKKPVTKKKKTATKKKPVKKH
jgi:hypothetical protein